MVKRKNDYESYAALFCNESQKITDGNAFPICMGSDICKNCCSLSCGFNKVVWVAPRSLLLTKKYYIFLWGAWCELKLSRRKMAAKVVNVLCDKCCANILDSEGKPFNLLEFNEVFPEDFDFTWFGTYLQADATGTKPKSYSPIVERLEYLDISAKLLNPKPFQTLSDKLKL
ncbi:MAG: hypothetical protein KAI61_06050 [Alphaproteobacteria bacterium]|nr:hypothetical protein [Alphaproteobacteria bacterium]MCK5659447.1 hypothetical protein [Alphaproteobacteria bacterium]